MRIDRIGSDEWSVQVQARSDRRRERWNTVVRSIETTNPLLMAGLLGGIAAVLPLLSGSDYLLRIAATSFLHAVLAAGLTVVAGYAGLLDLGYVAFFGFGAYAYALLASEQLGLHLPAWASVPLVVALAGCFGLLLGLPSLRLRGDYFAIVTLGCAQLFVLLAINFDRLELPDLAGRLNLTGGPNGITTVDRFRLWGWHLLHERDYYYLLLLTLAAVLTALANLNRSPLGRAWRSLREDALAAEAMGLPVRRLKLLAVMIGAAIAGLSGSIFAARQGAVFPGNFDLDLLLTLYAMVVFGGLGSLHGAVVGALALTVLPELLRDPLVARLLFYGGIVGAILIQTRFRRHGWALLAAVAIFGGSLKLLAAMVWPAFAGTAAATGGPGAMLQRFLIVPSDAPWVGNVVFVAVGALLALACYIRRPRLRTVVLVPAHYGAALVWEIRLADEPSITRLLVFGALLVVLMMKRPQGLFGQPRLEVV